jgi:superfamily II DNA or RNA helicase
MSTPILRDYQNEAIEKIRASYRSGKRAPLLCSPCGSGKTVLFAHMCAGARARGTKVLILAHRTELVDQISQALADEDCEHSYIAAGYPYRLGAGVYVASVFTVARRLADFAPDFVIVDECHHAIPRTTWGKVLAAYPQAKILGVTATPARLSGEGLGDIFDDLIIGPTHDELIQKGYLSPVRVYAPPTMDTSELHIRRGDYDSREVIDLVDQPRITGDCIAHYRRICNGARAIVFDVSVEAARKRAGAFRDAGYTADCISGDTPREVRALAVAEFRAGRLQILVSVDLISEGFDLPAVEVGISLRPTASLGLWLQQSGRVLRPFPGKAGAILLDHAGNTLRHGLPTETRSWTLAGASAAAHGHEPRRELRTCPACFAVSRVGAMVCRSCGKEFPIEPRKVSEIDGDLEEVTADRLAARRKFKEQGAARSYEALVSLGRMRRMRNPHMWAKHVLAARARKGRL